MNYFSREEILDVLSTRYGIDRESVRQEVVKYFLNCASNRMLVSMKKKGYDVPIHELMEEMRNGKSMKEVSKEYNLNVQNVKRRIEEYKVVTEGFDVELKNKKEDFQK